MAGLADFHMKIQSLVEKHGTLDQSLEDVRQDLKLLVHAIRSGYLIDLAVHKKAIARRKAIDRRKATDHMKATSHKKANCTHLLQRLHWHQLLLLLEHWHQHLHKDLKEAIDFHDIQG